MPTLDQVSAADNDYRASHLDKGGQYDARLAESPFDAYMSSWEREHLPRLLDRFAPQVQRYMDFACGTGRITEQVAPRARESVGVDLSPTMIDEARRKCAATRFHLGDLTQHDPDLGQFDLVTSFRFFGNAQSELRESALRAIVKRMTRGGHLIINSHRNPRALYALFDRLTGGDAGEKLDLHLPKLRALLARHGLDIVALQPIGVWMYRTGVLASTRADDPRAQRLEARFGSPMFAAVAPDLIVVARRG